mgnify:CR=1 FL=1
MTPSEPVAARAVPDAVRRRRVRAGETETTQSGPEPEDFSTFRLISGPQNGVTFLMHNAAAGVLPPSTLAAPLVFGAVAVFARRAEPGLATMLLVRGSYLFLATLVAAEWFRPLAGGPLPDVTVLGPYTYLATELAFGAAAAVLLHRTGAWLRALRTVVVLYPVAFAWDWYTLRVGVFSIPLRTGLAAFGIPLEEHLFMLVVPCLVVGIHEALDGRDRVATEAAPGQAD